MPMNMMQHMQSIPPENPPQWNVDHLQFNHTVSEPFQGGSVFNFNKQYPNLINASSILGQQNMNLQQPHYP